MGKIACLDGKNVEVRVAQRFAVESTNANENLLLVGCISLISCVPSVTTYQKFDIPGVEYLHGGCTGRAGPPSLVYFPFHDLYISINSRILFIGLHVPPGSEVLLQDTKIRIDGDTKLGAFNQTYELRAAPQHAIFARSPPELAAQPDLFTSRDNFGPLFGPSAGSAPAWYLYVAKDPQDPELLVGLPKDLVKGVLHLPPMTINGHHFESEGLSFTSANFAGVSGILCGP